MSGDYLMRSYWLCQWLFEQLLTNWLGSYKLTSCAVVGLYSGRGSSRWSGGSRGRGSGWKQRTGEIITNAQLLLVNSRIIPNIIYSKLTFVLGFVPFPWPLPPQTVEKNGVGKPGVDSLISLPPSSLRMTLTRKLNCLVTSRFVYVLETVLVVKLL